MFLFLFASVLSAAELRPANRSTDDIVNELRKKYSSVYKEYLGVEGVYHLEILELDPLNSDRLVSSANAEVIRRDYFYKKPGLEPLRFIKNGKTMLPSEYNPPSFEPTFPFFDENSNKHYRFNVMGITTINGREAYQIDVQPKKTGIRYFIGLLYIDIEKMSPMLMQGSIAAKYFFLKEFSIQLDLKDVQGASAMLNSTVKTRIHIPMVRKDRRFVTIMKGQEIKLINK